MDVVVTVPKGLWAAWVAEGDLPGDEAQYESHFWAAGTIPPMEPGSRVYVVAHGRLRGYAPLIEIEDRCALRPSTRCLLRGGGAVAVTIDEPIRGFQGVRRRWWDRARERPYPDWATDGVPADIAARINAQIGEAPAPGPVRAMPDEPAQVRLASRRSGGS